MTKLRKGTTYCPRCGSQIVFRRINGRRIPIHLNGRACSTRKARSGGEIKLSTVKAYMHPNARCSRCRRSIFLVQNNAGERLVFDEGAWPWSTHPCDSKYAHLARLPTSYYNKKKKWHHIHFRMRTSHLKSRSGTNLSVYVLSRLVPRGKTFSDRAYVLTFRNTDNHKTRTGILPLKDLTRAKIEIEDIRDAQSFIIDIDKSGGRHLYVYFICFRLKGIIRMKLAKHI